MLVKLKDIAQLRTGLVLSRKKVLEVTEDTNYWPYTLVTLKSFGEQGNLLTNNLDDFCSKEPISKDYITQKDDVLIRLRDPNLAIHIDEENEGLLIPSLVTIIRANDLVDSKFLTIYLTSTIVKKEIVKRGAQGGSGVEMVKTSFLEELPINLPTLERQKEIATFFDLANKEISLLEKLKVQKTNYYNTILNQIITQEIR